MSLFADIVFALPLPQAYTYAVPGEWAAAARPGARARAPLGPKTAAGIIVRVHDQPPAGAVLKPLLEVLDPEPIIPPEILDLAGRLSRRYYSSWGELLRPAVPPALSGASSLKAGLTKAGRAALAAGSLAGEEARIAGLLAKTEHSPSYFKRKSVSAGGAAVLARLIRKGFAETRMVEKKTKRRAVKAAPKPPVQMDLDFSIDESVARAAAGVAAAAAAGLFQSRLFFGPADRRASAYLACVRDVLARGRQVLFLYPEIGMSEAVSAAFAAGVGERIVLLHSRLTPREREAARLRTAGSAPLVVAGPRSALFTPLARLGLIIVDEESDDSFLQEESPVYDARVGARMRAEAAAVPLVFGAEAPTVEAFEKARREGGLVSMAGSEPPVRAALLDDRAERGLLSAPLRERLSANLALRKRAILFARRRGYAAFLLCPRCGHVPRCPRCDIAMTLHQKGRRLLCRYCSETQPAPSACPRCGGRIWEPRGAGVEAVAEELRKHLPSARAAVFDSETLRNRESREKVLARFAEGAVDVLVATPLLVHQPGVPAASLIGVLNPEQGLGQSDFRAGQRAFAEIRRFLRFLDRSDIRAEAVLQTSVPEHPLLAAAAAGDYKGFFDAEIEYRRMLGYPPFAAMAEIALWGRDAPGLERKAGELAARLRRAGIGEVLGPAEIRAGGARGMQLVAKAAEAAILDGVLSAELPLVKGKKSVSRYD
jgi:primosomal protein N' (replication factor Y) (superfamily II helicase)